MLMRSSGMYEDKVGTAPPWPPPSNTPPSIALAAAECQTVRRTTCCIPTNGSGGHVQGQSLPNASVAPLSAKLCQRSVGVLSCGSKFEPTSLQQKDGCVLTSTESLAKRGKSSVGKISACSIRKRRSRGPLTFSTSSYVSRTMCAESPRSAC